MMKSIDGKAILVIDDDPRLLRALNQVLTGAGANVSCASWAGDGIEILTRRDPPIDLVITDLRMPLLNGVTVTYAVHKIFPLLPVIVLTAYASPEVMTTCLDQGAVAFLEKPVDSQELIAAVQKALSAPAPARGSSPSPTAKLTKQRPRSKGR